MTNLVYNQGEDGVDDEALPVPQDGFSFTVNHTLATFNLSFCLGIVIHDPLTNHGCLAHLTSLGGERAEENRAIDIIKKMHKRLWGADGHEAECRVRYQYFLCNGGTASWGVFLPNYVGNPANFANVIDARATPDKIAGAVDGGIDLLGSICYDPSTARVRRWNYRRAGVIAGKSKTIGRGFRPFRMTEVKAKGGGCCG